MAAQSLPLLPEMPSIRPSTPDSSIVGSYTSEGWDLSPVSSRSLNTSPSVSRSGSPDIKSKAKFQGPKLVLPLSDQEAEDAILPKVKSICFVGAGFVG